MTLKSTKRPAAGEVPLLPLRSMTLLPGLAQPIELGRTKSVGAVQSARERSPNDPLANLIVVATQRDPLTESPQLEDLHPIGVLAEVTQALKGVPGRMTAIVRGLERVRLLGLMPDGSKTLAMFQRAHETLGDPTLAYALSGALQDLVKQHEELISPENRNRNRSQTLAVVLAERSPGLVCDLSAVHVNLDAAQQIDVLHELTVSERLRKLIEFISHRINVTRVKRDLDQHVREHLSRHEQEALLRHKLRAIQGELGGHDDGERWLEELEQRIEDAKLPVDAYAIAHRELDRLKHMNPQSSEASIARNYLELLADLPWSQTPSDTLDIDAARNLLEREHYGLAKIKRRIVEYLCVRKLAPDKRGPILCLAGPPGVGKTSLARSIALALDRQFVRAALGGVRDDAEIRGHRRTYVGALPGRIIMSMKKAGTTNPVFLLDELDKLTAPDLRGDPAGALLEALDPEQNDAFEDHYLGTPYDLSKVIFICTANDASRIPNVLRDRLELIELSGYTTPEKLEIGRRHLLPRLAGDHGLSTETSISTEALELIATQYTREAGVRGLQRQLEAILRDVAMGVAEDVSPPDTIDVDDVSRILGPPTYHEDLVDPQPMIGVVTGLGWTPVGGRLLFVEARSTPGEGKIRLTGRLGDVMRESGQTALSLIRSQASRFGLPTNLTQRDFHVHVPAGGIPKDGPSAGVTVTIALISHLAHRPVRPRTAMTGEITLHGQILPVGGIREKVLAAHRAGIRTVVLPHGNQKDEVDIPDQVRSEMSFHYVKRIDEVIDLVLDPPKDNLSTAC